MIRHGSAGFAKHSSVDRQRTTEMLQRPFKVPADPMYLADGGRGGSDTWMVGPERVLRNPDGPTAGFKRTVQLALGEQY